MNSAETHYADDKNQTAHDSNPGLEKLPDPLGDEFEHLRRQAGIDADEKRLVHDRVGAGQFTVDAARNVLETGLLENIPAEDKPRLDFDFLQPEDEVAPLDMRLERDRKTEP